jgi:hypothetical protein
MQAESQPGLTLILGRARERTAQWWRDADLRTQSDPKSRLTSVA